MHPKAKLQNAPSFTGNGSYSHVCVLLVIKIKTCTYHLCKQQLDDTNVLIGRNRLSATADDRSVGQYKLWADYWSISTRYRTIHSSTKHLWTSNWRG